MNILKKKTQFYYNMLDMENAGLLRAVALRQQKHYFPRVIPVMANLVEKQGVPMSRAMQQYSGIFSMFECKMVEIGERTGNINLIFKALSEWFAFQQKTRSTIISGLLYPMFMYHISALLMPFVIYVTSKEKDFNMFIIHAILATFAPYLVIIVWKLLKKLLSPIFSHITILSSILLNFPFLGNLLKKLDLCRFFKALYISVFAGLGLGEAIELSAYSCKNRCLQDKFHDVSKLISRNGIPFTAACSEVGLSIPGGDMILSLLRSGEISGTFDTACERVAEKYGEESKATIKGITIILPVVVYLIIAVVIAMFVINFYSKLFNGYNDLGNI